MIARERTSRPHKPQTRETTMDTNATPQAIAAANDLLAARAANGTGDPAVDAMTVARFRVLAQGYTIGTCWAENGKAYASSAETCPNTFGHPMYETSEHYGPTDAEREYNRDLALRMREGRLRAAPFDRD